jgi:acyl carrier protein
VDATTIPPAAVTTEKRAPVEAEAVIAIVQEVLRDQKHVAIDVSTETVLEALGLTSLDVTEIFLRAEALAGRELDPEEAIGVESVGDLVRAINGDG